jgi:hypothetical protein
VPAVGPSTYKVAAVSVTVAVVAESTLGAIVLKTKAVTNPVALSVLV